MKTNIRSKRLACYSILGDIKAQTDDKHEHKLVFEIKHVTGKGTFAEASHYEVNRDNGLGFHSFALFGTYKKPVAIIGDKPRFNAKFMEAAIAAIQNDPTKVEDIAAKELWNKFKAYPHQLVFDHNVGTITVLKNEDAVCITPDNQVIEMSPKKNVQWTLQELYNILDCELIEVINLGENLILIIDEEGKCKGDPVVNAEATAVCKHYIKGWNDTIVGNAMLCPSSMLR